MFDDNFFYVCCNYNLSDQICLHFLYLHFVHEKIYNAVIYIVKLVYFDIMNTLDNTPVLIRGKDHLFEIEISLEIANPFHNKNVSRQWNVQILNPTTLQLSILNSQTFQILFSFKLSRKKSFDFVYLTFCFLLLFIEVK